jgi:hypothetical protein
MTEINSTHLERILIVVGDPNAGKSYALRSMFVDPRFGTQGVVPDEKQKRMPLVALSRERCLQVRLSSPHEKGETLDGFLADLSGTISRLGRRGFRRANIACAMQHVAAKKMPDLMTICRAIKARLRPERMRIAIIDPRQDAMQGPDIDVRILEALRKLEAEIIWIDSSRGAKANANGLLLADYFDFT